MMQYRKKIIPFLVLLTLVSGCERKEDSGEKGKLLIVTTTNIIADCIRDITGNSAEVVSIMGHGVDPHTYKAAQGDVELLLKADLIVYNGLHLEGKMTDVLKNLSKRRKTVCLSDGLNPEDIRSISVEADVHDPHFWFDLTKWKKGLQHFVKDAGRYYPQLSETLEQRSSNYFRQMDELHQEIKDAIANIPTGQRILITSHDAFEYYGEAYNIRVRGLQGISTLSEAGLKDVTEMVNFISSNNVKAVFVESSVSQKALMSVVEGCKRNQHNIVIGGELFSDALDSKGRPGGTYLGMLQYNTSTIVNALK